MIVANDGSDTALARLLLSQATLDVETLRRALQAVRGERDLTGLTLAQVLRTRDLVPAPVLEQALETLSARRATTETSPLPDLPDHRVVGELARGGMGVVYEVERISDGARFALKTLLPAGLTFVPDALEEERVRFVREAQALAQLKHPHVVRIHGANLECQVPYMIQDLLPGGTLAERLRRGPLPWAQAIEITSKLCAGLAHAHSQGLLHRDLKPQNVLFDDQDQPRLVDFGLVRSLAGSSLTQTGQLLGTPAYMAPEQAFGHEADVRTDVYGMGAVLYALLTGRPPFEGAGLGILAAVVEDRPLPISSPEVEVPAWLEATCLRALEKDPEDRYASLELLQEALEGRSEATPKKRRLPWIWLVGLVALCGAAVPGATRLNAWRAERTRLQAQTQALAELDLALQVSVAAVHSGLPKWSKLWPEDPPPKLVLARGLSALVEGDLARAEVMAKQLAGPKGSKELRAAVRGGIAAASSGRSPGAVKLLRRARRHPALRDLPDLEAWEIRLLLRSSQDSDQAAALALLSRRLRNDPAATPTDKESRLALRAVLALKGSPSRETLEHVERLLPNLQALETWRIYQTLNGSIEADFPKLANESVHAPEVAPPFLTTSLGRMANDWEIELIELLEPTRAKGEWASFSPELYRHITAWLQIASRLRTLDEFDRLIGELLAHARKIIPISLTLGGADPAERARSRSTLMPDAVAQAEFLRELIAARPNDQSLRADALRLVLQVPGEVRHSYRPCLTAILEVATPEEFPWVHIYHSHLRAREPETNLEEVLAELTPYLSLPELGRDPPHAVLPLTQHDLRALLLWTLAHANFRLDRPDAALRHYEALSSLPQELHESVPRWRYDQLRLRRTKAENLPPGEARDQALRVVALSALRHSLAWRKGPFHLQNLVSISWELRRFLSLAELHELIEATRVYRKTRFFEWILRRAAMLIEAGQPQEAAGELRFDFSFRSLEVQPSEKFLAEARELAEQAESVQTPAERATFARRIRDLIVKHRTERRSAERR